jgi:hypothetical protein
MEDHMSLIPSWTGHSPLCSASNKFSPQQIQPQALHEPPFKQRRCTIQSTCALPQPRPRPWLPI